MATAISEPAETLIGSSKGYLLASGKIRFQGSRTDTLSSPYSDYIVIHKNTPVELVINYMKTEWELYDPDVLFSVTGGAVLKGMLPRHEPTFKEGFAAAAGSVASWVVTGGTDRGVMRMVGDAVAQNSVEVPCIGIATLGKMVGWKDLIRKKGWVNDSDTYEYDMTRMMERAAESRASDGGETDTEGKEGTSTLNPGHSHFVLVHSMDAECARTKIMKFVVRWGDENVFREAFEEALPTLDCVKSQQHLGAVPVQLVVNGGPETMKTVSSAVHSNIPVISFRGTGRAADLLCVLQRHSQHMEAAWRTRADGDRKPNRYKYPNRDDSDLDRIQQEIRSLAGGRAGGDEQAAEQAAEQTSRGGEGGGPAAGSVQQSLVEGSAGNLHASGNDDGQDKTAGTGSDTCSDGGGHGSGKGSGGSKRHGAAAVSLGAAQLDASRLSDNSIIDARVFHPMDVNSDWKKFETTNVWVPRPLYEWMAGLARPPSPLEYFEFLADPANGMENLTIEDYKSAWSAVYTLDKAPGREAGSGSHRRVVKCNAQAIEEVVKGHMRLAKARANVDAADERVERPVREDEAKQIELQLKDVHEGRLPAPVLLPTYEGGELEVWRRTRGTLTRVGAGEGAGDGLQGTSKEKISVWHELHLLNERAVEYLWCWCAHIKLLQMGNLMRPQTEKEEQEEATEEAQQATPTGGAGSAHGSMTPTSTTGTPRSILPHRRLPAGRRSSISMCMDVMPGSDRRLLPAWHTCKKVVRTTIRHALEDLCEMETDRRSGDEISQKEFTKVWPLLMRAMQAVRLGTVVAANLEQLTKQAQDTRDRQRESTQASDYWNQLAVQSQQFGAGMASAVAYPVVASTQSAESAEAVSRSGESTLQGSNPDRERKTGTSQPVAAMQPTGGASSSRAAMQRSLEPKTPTRYHQVPLHELGQQSSMESGQPRSISSITGGSVSSQSESGLESPVPQAESTGARSYVFGGMDDGDEKYHFGEATEDRQAAGGLSLKARVQASRAPRPSMSAGDADVSPQPCVRFQSLDKAPPSVHSLGEAAPSSMIRGASACSQSNASTAGVQTVSEKQAKSVEAGSKMAESVKAGLAGSKSEGSKTRQDDRGLARHSSNSRVQEQAAIKAAQNPKGATAGTLIIANELRKHCGEGPTLQAEIARAVLIGIKYDESPEHPPTTGHTSQLVRRLKLAVQWECEDVVQAWVHGVQSLVKKNVMIDKPKRMAMEAALAYAALRDNNRIAKVFLDESVPVDIESVDLLCLKQLLPERVCLDAFTDDRYIKLHRKLWANIQKSLSDSEKGCNGTKKKLRDNQDKIRECKKKIWRAMRRESHAAHSDDAGDTAPLKFAACTSSSGSPMTNPDAARPRSGSDGDKTVKSPRESPHSSSTSASEVLRELKRSLQKLQDEAGTLKKQLRQNQLLPVRLLPGRHWLEDLVQRLRPHVSREFPQTALDAALREARMTSCKLEEALESVRVVWALVNRRFRIARLFWRHCSQPLRVALYAAQVLRRLAEVTSSSQQTLEMEADWYETMAIELFSLAGASRQIGGWENSDWKDAALWLRSTAPASWIVNDLIVRYHATPTLDQAGDVGFLESIWRSQPGLLSMGKLYKPGGGKNMIRLAQQGRCQRFIGHPIVQRVLENLWDRGSWDVTASSIGAVLFIAGSWSFLDPTPCLSFLEYAFCGIVGGAAGAKPVSQQESSQNSGRRGLPHCLDEEVGNESIVEPHRISEEEIVLTVTRQQLDDANQNRQGQSTEREQLGDFSGPRAAKTRSIDDSMPTCCAALCCPCRASWESKDETTLQQQQERAYLGTSVETPDGKVPTVSVLQELKNRRLRLERARETHQVLEVNRQARKYRRLGSQGAVRKQFTRQGAGAVIDGVVESQRASIALDVAGSPPNQASSTSTDRSIDVSSTNKMQRVDDPDKSHVGWEYHLVCSPHWKFVAHSLSRLVLTFAHAALVMSQNSMQAQPFEVLFYVWKFSQCAEDVVGTYYQGLKHIVVWDIFGLLDYGATVLALAIRIIASTRDDLDLLDYAWDVLSLSFIIASIRLLDVLAVIQYFGPLVITISRILLRDIMLFMVLLIIFLGGFAVAITAIFVVRNDTIRIGDPSENRLEALEDLLWSVFGDWTLPLSNADRGDEVFYLGLGKALLGLHMLLSTIVIVNLLIALMSNSFEQTNKLSDLEFKASRVQHISKYLSASSLPPPLNLLTIGWCCMKRGHGCATAQCSEARSDTEKSALEKRSMHDQQDALSKMHRSRAGAIYNQPAMLPLNV